MKNTITVLLAVFVLIICNLTFNIDNCICQWQPDVRLTNQSDSSFTYFASGGRWNVAANGSVVHVVWCETRDGNKEIYYKRSTDSGINWGADTRLTNAAGDSWYPSISVSGLLVHVIWGDRRYGPNQEICYKRSTDGGINWEADLRLTNDTSSTSFCSISSTGLFVHVMFHDNRTGNWQIYYKRSTDGGITWGNDNRLSNTSASSYYPSVSVSGFNVHVVWHDTRDGSSEIYYKRSTDGGINWSADTRLTNDPSLSSCAQIAVSGSNVHVIWYDNRNGNYEIYYKFSVDGGINWDVDTRLTNDPALSHYPCVAVLGSAIDVIWADTRDGNYEIYFKQSTNGGVSWGTDTRLTYDPAESSYPSIAVSGSVVHVVWTDNRDGNYEIYYKRNPTGNPIGIVPINSEIPKEYKLFQNYPNPFNPVTKINFDIAKSGFVSIIIYDALGREIETLVNEVQSAGSYSVDFNASNLSGGVYFYRLQSTGFTDVKKLVLLK